MKNYLWDVREALCIAGIITAAEAIRCILGAIVSFIDHQQFYGLMLLLAAFGFGLASYRSFYIVINSTITVNHPKSNSGENELPSTTHDK